MNTLVTGSNPRRTTMSDPLQELGDMENQIGHFIADSVHMATAGEKEMLTVPEWAPLVDITEDEVEYQVKADLPELKKNEVKVTVGNGELSISGERKFEKEVKGKKYHRIERSYGSFERSFTLPTGVNGKKASVQFKDGLLTVHLPKDKKTKTHEVKVK